jgi:D-3-phosphoglycerate dehydrogenase
MAKSLVVQTNVPPEGSRPIEAGVLSADPNVEFALRGFCGTPEQLIAALHDADVGLCGREYYTRAVFEQTPRLKGVVRYGVGVDTIDLAAATEHGVVVAYFPDFCTEEVANHTLALLLACAKKLVWLDRAFREEGWYEAKRYNSPMGTIHGETLGLLAFGTIAQAVAKRAQAFDMKIIAYDPFQDPAVFARTGVEQVGLSELATRADYVSCHVPLTEKTRGMIDATFFAQMKPTGYFINTSRGALVKEADMIIAVQEKQIAGVGLDVFEDEPVYGKHPLFNMPNVVLTPHNAAWADATFVSLYKRVGQAALDIIHGKLPEYVANPEVIDRLT